jgi:hypothetical protein
MCNDMSDVNGRLRLEAFQNVEDILRNVPDILSRNISRNTITMKLTHVPHRYAVQDAYHQHSHSDEQSYRNGG